MTDQTALAEINEHNRVLAENLVLQHKVKTLTAHCLNMLGKLDVVENTVPRIILDLASTMTLDTECTDRGSTIRRKITHHMGS